MAERTVDLRSDTTTLPTDEMRDGKIVANRIYGDRITYFGPFRVRLFGCAINSSGLR